MAPGSPTARATPHPGHMDMLYGYPLWASEVIRPVSDRFPDHWKLPALNRPSTSEYDREAANRGGLSEAVTGEKRGGGEIG